MDFQDSLDNFEDSYYGEWDRKKTSSVKLSRSAMTWKRRWGICRIISTMSASLASYLCLTITWANMVPPPSKFSPQGNFYLLYSTLCIIMYITKFLSFYITLPSSIFVPLPGIRYILFNSYAFIIANPYTPHTPRISCISSLVIFYI